MGDPSEIQRIILVTRLSQRIVLPSNIEAGLGMTPTTPGSCLVPSPSPSIESMFLSMTHAPTSLALPLRTLSHSHPPHRRPDLPPQTPTPKAAPADRPRPVRHRRSLHPAQARAPPALRHAQHVRLLHVQYASVFAFAFMPLASWVAQASAAAVDGLHRVQDPAVPRLSSNVRLSV
ncbi:hypothetical protein BD414DRAFT_499369 [Trametes punicea]|nr:hypothetical protein BD414DRAFT_499369 [Trametes punicea]